MNTINLIILYVSDLDASTGFYEKLLDTPPAETMPDFNMFAMGNGQMLCLQTVGTTTSKVTGGGGELTFQFEEDAEVDAKHDEWTKHGFTIVETPAQLPYGYTCLVADPDGHRIRVYAPAAAPATA